MSIFQLSVSIHHFRYHITIVNCEGIRYFCHLVFGKFAANRRQVAIVGSSTFMNPVKNIHIKTVERF